MWQSHSTLQIVIYSQLPLENQNQCFFFSVLLFFFQINDFQLRFNYKTVTQSILLVYTQCKVLQETCVRNEACSEHINRKGWFSFAFKSRRNGLDSQLYQNNSKGLSGVSTEMKVHSLHLPSQRNKQSLLKATHPDFPPCGIPHLLCCLLIPQKHSLPWQWQW